MTQDRNRLRDRLLAAAVAYALGMVSALAWEAGQDRKDRALLAEAHGLAFEDEAARRDFLAGDCSTDAECEALHGPIDLGGAE